MHIIKINDNLKINLDTIYSLQHFTNNDEIANFEKYKLAFLQENFKDEELPEFEINGNLYKPSYDDIINNNESEEINEYYVKLNDYLNNILNKPEEKDEYILILSTGSKIIIDKPLYDKIDKMLEKFIVNND